MGKVQTQGKIGKFGDTFGLTKLILARQSWQSSDVTLFLMGKVRTQSKNGKVWDTFGLI